MVDMVSATDQAPREQRLGALEREVAVLKGDAEQRRLIVDNATDTAIFTIDRPGTVTSWNSGAERLLGYSEEEIIGRDGRLIFTPEDRSDGVAEREIATALAEGRAENERWHVRKDGSRFWGSGLIMPLKHGAPGLLKIMRDGTERRRSEELKKLLIGELDHRVKNILAMVRSLADHTLKRSTAWKPSGTPLRAGFSPWPMPMTCWPAKPGSAPISAISPIRPFTAGSMTAGC